MKCSNLLAYIAVTPVLAPILFIDCVGEKLIDVSSFLEDKVVDPYCAFWKKVIKAIDLVVEDKQYK